MNCIALAWVQLTNEKLRLVAAVAGIIFAVVLMLMQLGLRAALLDSAVLHYNNLQADLVLISSQYEYIVAAKTFDQQRLYQTLAFAGVESVASVYLAVASLKNPITHEEGSLLVLGFDPQTDAFHAEGVREHLKTIAMPDVVIFDAKSHPSYGPVADLLQRNESVVTELNGRRVKVAGLFRLGIGFAAISNVVTSDLNFLRIFPYRNQNAISIGLIRLKPGVDPEQVRAQIAARLPKDVRVLTHDAFIEKEKEFWTTLSPIGFIFGMGVVMGLIVGSVIVYQILYTDVNDHLAEYATLKAVGYSDGYLFSLVFVESIILSILGYLPGLAISWAAYVGAARSTGLPVYMTPERIALVFAFTFVMCCSSGALAMRRLKSADPAEVF